MEMRVWWRVLSLADLIAGIWGGAIVPLASVPPPPPGIRLLRADRSGLVLEWSAPQVEMRPLYDGTIEVVAGGYAQTAQPGEPRLPFASALIALPPGAVPRLRSLSLEETTQPLPAAIAVAPRPEGVVRDKRGHAIGGAFAPADRERRAVSASPIVMEEIGTMRGVRLARLTFYPALPQGQTLRVVRHLRIEVSWEAWAPPALTTSDPLLEQVRRQALNPWDAVPAPRSAGRQREKRLKSPLRTRHHHRGERGGAPTAFTIGKSILS